VIIIGKKEVPLKCGFCNEKINDWKELHTTRMYGKALMSCPHCNAILGFI